MSRCVGRRVARLHRVAGSLSVLEHRQKIRDANLVVVTKKGAASDRLVVNAGSVPRIQVLDIPFPVLEPELRVLPTDSRGVDDKLAIGIAPDNEGVASERDALPWGHDWVLRNAERCHVLDPQCGKSGRGTFRP